jgi:RNase adaptor protein for sRNA GlmZ degradation
MLYEPYHDGHEGSGIDRTIAQMVIRENRKFLSSLKPYLRESIENFRFSRKYHSFNLCFGCAGGWQRSVATAEYFRNWLAKNFPSLKLVSRHLTIEKNQV